MHSPSPPRCLFPPGGMGQPEPWDRSPGTCHLGHSAGLPCLADPGLPVKPIKSLEAGITAVLRGPCPSLLGDLSPGQVGQIPQERSQERPRGPGPAGGDPLACIETHARKGEDPTRAALAVACPEPGTISTEHFFQKSFSPLAASLGNQILPLE